jgi:hypothetical protein
MYNENGVKRFVFLLVCCAAEGASLRYWVEPCAKPESDCRASDPELAQWAMEAWQTASAGKLKLEKTDVQGKAHIRIHWATGNDGLYGEARPIMVDGVQGAEVYVLPAAAPPNGADALLRETIVYLTCLHETGHALGLRHTAAFADIMYNFQFGGDIAEYFGRYRRLLSSRADIRKHAGISAEDRTHLLDLWTAVQ